MSAKFVSTKRASLLHLLKQSSSSLRHFSTDVSPITTTDEKKQISSSEAERHLITLLKLKSTNDNEHHLRNLLPLISPPRLPQIFRRLDTASTALTFLQYLQTNSPSNLLPISQSLIYQTIFQHACREKDSHIKLNEILQTCNAHSVPLTTDSASILIRHFSRANLIDESIKVFTNLEASVKNTHLCNTLLDSLYRWDRVDDARKMLDEMLQPESRFPPNAFTGGIFFTMLVKRDGPGRSVNGDEVIELVAKLGEYDVFPETTMLTKLITLFGKRGDVGKAWELLHVVMEMHDDSVDAAPVNALLTVLGRANDFQKMNLLLAEMKENGIEPNGVTFGILVHHLCKARRIGEALQVLDGMEKDKENGGVNVVPDLITYNTIVKGLCQVGRPEDSICLVDRMKSRHGYKLNTVTYNALIDGFGKAGEIERSRELFDQMQEEGVSPDVITLNILIHGMCRHGRISSALEFFNDMQSNGIKGNAITYTSLISAFCNVNNLGKASSLFDEMVSTNCMPDSIVYYTLINGFCRAGRLDDACSVASKMKSAGFSLDKMSYNVLISGFCKKKKLDKVYEIIEEMEVVGIRPDEVTYNTLIATLSKSGDFSTVRGLLTEMTDQGLVPTVVTYGALIHGYCKVGMVSEAFEIFNLLGTTTKVLPNTVIYNILIESLCREKEAENALSLMDDMKAKGVLPNVITYNAMFKGLRDMDWLDKAFILMDNMSEQAVNPDYVTMEILTEWLSDVGEIARLKYFVQGYEVL